MAVRRKQFMTSVVKFLIGIERNAVCLDGSKFYMLKMLRPKVTALGFYRIIIGRQQRAEIGLIRY